MNLFNFSFKDEAEDIYNQLEKFESDCDKLVSDYSNINKKVMRDYDLFSYERMESFRMDGMATIMECELAKSDLIEFFDLSHELKQHEMAVFLNTECGLIYDIAVNISEFI